MRRLAGANIKWIWPEGPDSGAFWHFGVSLNGPLPSSVRDRES